VQRFFDIVRARPLILTATFHRNATNVKDCIKDKVEWLPAQQNPVHEASVMDTELYRDDKYFLVFFEISRQLTT
jgi:hypothetical protein